MILDIDDSKEIKEILDEIPKCHVDEFPEDQSMKPRQVIALNRMILPSGEKAFSFLFDSKWNKIGGQNGGRRNKRRTFTGE